MRARARAWGNSLAFALIGKKTDLPTISRSRCRSPKLRTRFTWAFRTPLWAIGDPRSQNRRQVGFFAAAERQTIKIVGKSDFLPYRNRGARLQSHHALESNGCVSKKTELCGAPIVGLSFSPDRRGRVGGKPAALPFDAHDDGVVAWQIEP